MSVVEVAPAPRVAPQPPVVSDEVRDVLRKAKGLLSGGVCKAKLSDGLGNVCALGAISAARGWIDPTIENSSGYPDDDDPAALALWNSLPVVYRYGVPGYVVDALYRFNDDSVRKGHPERVVALFDRALGA